ncbi:hypothetical protein EON64_12600 [archaeon]|nr:MAG: hypothetical protein EON64_12600 [archaeon]
MVLYFPIKQFSPRFGDEFFTFTISGFSVHDSEMCFSCGDYVLFTFDMQRGKVKWSVKHRFSEMERMHKTLVSATSLLGISLPAFPPKTLLPVVADTAFLQQRQEALYVYFDTVLKTLSPGGDIESFDTLCDFFSLDSSQVFSQ